ncbi:MAG: MFS transporter [Xanthobacteraceae bacterium]|nr:MFS transporter [Xanthobacteraceae bacterium]
MPSVLYLIALASFAANLSVRAIDPVIPHIADDLGVSIAQAAGLSAALAFTFAIVQPIIGAIADLVGKARVMVTCLALLGVGSILGSFAETYPLLLVTRIVCGVGAGGVFPVTLSLTSDLVPVSGRQVAISRVLAGAMIGNILGSTLGGVVGDLFGWRGVLGFLGVTTVIASVAVGVGLSRTSTAIASGGTSLATLWHGYQVLFRNPRTRVCYSVVFIEGCCVLGVFPFVAAFLFDLGETRLSIAGVVIAGFALGGLVYTASVTGMLRWMGVRGLMIGGGALMALQLVVLGLGLPWQAQMASFVVMGLGFYMLHGCMQVFASELAVEARATSMSLHSCFFFLGQTAGPIVYGFGIAHAGKMPTLIVCAVIMALVGIVAARLLVTPAPEARAAV